MQKYRKRKCLYCEKEMDGEHFCSAKCKIFFHNENDFCYYCGAENASRKNVNEHSICKECRVLTDSSKECCTAGNARMLLEIYQQKYEKQLQLIDWDEEELQDMGQNMQSAIRFSLKEKHKIESRIACLQYCSLIHTCEEQ